MRRYRIAVTILFLAAASCLFFLWPREPRFQGRPLSSWLAALDDGTGEKGITWSPNPPVVPTPRQLEAAVAVRGLGAKATTQLLAMLAAGEPVVRTFKEVVRQWSIRLRLAGQPRQVQYERQTPATVMRHRAALGLLALDASARPSVSQLGELFANPELSKEAALVLASLGDEGLRPLIPFIRTNQTSWQAVCAVWALAQSPTNA
ncbi:MAG TPA: hypothetical protein VHI52_01905, partial [Verrucomicrobiae bacterium]|nr:hypothetical protein [Verrucomicrobiae bacterium]